MSRSEFTETQSQDTIRTFHRHDQKDLKELRKHSKDAGYQNIPEIESHRESLDNNNVA